MKRVTFAPATYPERVGALKSDGDVFDLTAAAHGAVAASISRDRALHQGEVIRSGAVVGG